MSKLRVLELFAGLGGLTINPAMPINTLCQTNTHMRRHAAKRNWKVCIPICLRLNAPKLLGVLKRSCLLLCGTMGLNPEKLFHETKKQRITIIGRRKTQVNKRFTADYMPFMGSHLSARFAARMIIKKHTITPIFLENIMI